MKHSLIHSSRPDSCGKTHTTFLVSLFREFRELATPGLRTSSSSDGRLVPLFLTQPSLDELLLASIKASCASASKDKGPIANFPSLARPISMLSVACPTSRPLPFVFMFFQLSLPVTHNALGFLQGGRADGCDVSFPTDVSITSSIQNSSLVPFLEILYLLFPS